MLTAKNITVALTGLCLFAGGCVGVEPSGDGDVDMASMAEEIIVMNGDDPVFFWQPSTQEALRALAQAPLGSSTGEIVNTPLLASAGGRRLLAYVVTCALSGGGELHSTIAGVSFGGAVGLASQWASARLDSVGAQRWVTACLLQTLNGLGMQVPIRMSGSHPVFANDPGAVGSDFSVPEATMFGNLFGAIDRGTFACMDTRSDSCGIALSNHTLQRICGLSPTCGITNLGPCAFSCNWDAAGYPSCTGPAGGLYAEAISTTLQRNVTLTLSQDCGL